MSRFVAICSSWINQCVTDPKVRGIWRLELQKDSAVQDLWPVWDTWLAGNLFLATAVLHGMFCVTWPLYFAFERRKMPFKCQFIRKRNVVCMNSVWIVFSEYYSEVLGMYRLQYLITAPVLCFNHLQWRLVLHRSGGGRQTWPQTPPLRHPTLTPLLL